MEILNGIKNYDIGYLIYDLWTVIEVLFWTSIFSVLIKKQNWISKNYITLGAINLIVLIEINTNNLLINIFLIFLYLFIFQKRFTDFVLIGLCFMLGFGITLIPFGIAVLFSILKRYFKII